MHFSPASNSVVVPKEEKGRSRGDAEVDKRQDDVNSARRFEQFVVANLPFHGVEGFHRLCIQSALNLEQQLKKK